MNFFGFFHIPIFELSKTKSEIFITSQAFQKMRKLQTAFNNFPFKSTFFSIFKKYFFGKNQKFFRCRTKLVGIRMGTGWLIPENDILQKHFFMSR